MKTIFVALSGGVDSAVSAYLLQRQGYKVVGAFIKVWEPDWLPCTSGADRLDAMRVAASLGIPFKTYDLAEEYKREVVDYFVEEYRQGRTPNSDVMCNRVIKFGTFWDRARADGADMISTGHYARNEAGKLLRGTDPAKDQSYFLWMLNADDLAHSLFPVGGMLKKDVRRIAEEVGLPNARKRDSQGLCFMGHIAMKEFLMRMLETDSDDPRLYTIGERVAGQYVVAKDLARLTLAPLTSDVGRQSYTLEKVNWIYSVPEENKHYEVQVRYHGEKYVCRLQAAGVRWTVKLKKLVLAAPGQSLVVYDPETSECLGGGIIS